MNYTWLQGFSIHRSMASMPKLIENSIKTKLQSTLEAKHLDVINESYMHNVPQGAETHFRVVVVSDKFEGMPLIKRHRLVNEALKEELETGVHALSIIAKTPEQWENSDKVVEPSPNCRGGFGNIPSTLGVLQSMMKTKLQSALEATYLNVINESYMHNKPEGSETHLRVHVISDKFKGLPQINRHRLVNSIVKKERQAGVCALTIIAETPQQWEDRQKIRRSAENLGPQSQT